MTIHFAIKQVPIKKKKIINKHMKLQCKYGTQLKYYLNVAL